MDSFDQFLKHLLHRDPADFIGFGLGGLPVVVLSPEECALPSRSRDIDGAYLYARAADRDPVSGAFPGECVRLSHIEFHRRHQSLEELAIDVAEAQIRLFRRRRRRCTTLVWDLYGDPDEPLLSKRSLSYGEDGSQCVYTRVNLRSLGWRELLSQGPAALWALVALTRDGQSEEAVSTAHQAIQGHTPWSEAERADHLAVLWFVAEAEGVPAKLMQAMFTRKQLMESELYKSIFGEGKAEAYRDLLIDELIVRLGTLEPAVRERARAVTDPQTLKVWCTQVLRGDADSARRMVETIRNVQLQ